MALLLTSLVEAFLLLSAVIMLAETKNVVNQCKLSSRTDFCKQECNKDCNMKCAKALRLLKSCDQGCRTGRCDMRCVTKETCLQTCDPKSNCDSSLFCKTSNCTQKCDVGNCDMSCRATSQCEQSCNEGSCKLKCPKTGQHCKQVSAEKVLTNYSSRGHLNEPVTNK